MALIDLTALIQNRVSSENGVYTWLIDGELYDGTILDVVSFFGFNNNTFKYNCPNCGKLFTKTGYSIRDRGLLCRSCVWKKKTEKARESEAVYNVAITNPEIVTVWDFDKNSRNIKTVLPYERGTEFWFKCKKGHSFKKSMFNMIRCVNSRFQGCPECLRLERESNLVVNKGKDILKFWDYSKNKENPENLTLWSGGEYNFICEKGHSYSSSLGHVYRSITESHGRVSGCPYCANKIITYENSFAGRFPEKVKYWDMEKNKGVKPEEVAFHTEVKYWFKCDEGHSYFVQPWSVGTSNFAGCRICSGKEVIEGVNDLATLYKDLVDKFWDYDGNIISPREVTRQSTKIVSWLCINCGCSYYQRIDSRINCVGYCPSCRETFTRSRAEKELADIIKSWGVSCKETIKIGSYNYDFLILDKNLVIEFNGIYWHSTAVVEDIGRRNKLKYENLIEKGYSLYVIWEDDWKYRRDVVISSLMRKLGISKEDKINARECEMCIADFSSGLLDEVHIQGDIPVGSKYLQLVFNGDVVAELAYRIESLYVNIVRYASKGIVRGGFSKLLSLLIDVVKEGGVETPFSICTFSDNQVSDGNLYARCGFQKIGELPVDYKYVYNGMRVHKFNFRKERFKKDPKLKYEEGMTEKELANLNKIYRVYDYGKVKWQLIVEK